MNQYERLAEELLDSLDKNRHGPPHEEMSAAMRGEMAVLRFLACSGAPVSAGDISRLLQMTTSRIAAVLGSLEKKQLLLRTADSTDRRRVLVTLTPQGRAFWQRRRQEALRGAAHLLAQLGEEDAEHFVRINKRICGLMQHPPACRPTPDCSKEEP